MNLVPIKTLNTLPRAEFVAALRPLFEAAEPLADALYAARPFESYEALLDSAAVEVERLPRQQQVEVLNAHPRIGESAVAVSNLSYREQGYAAEAVLDSTEVAATYERLRVLN